MKNLLIVIGVAIGTGLGLIFSFSFLSKVLFQNEESQLLFACFASMLLSIGVIITCLIFSKKLTRENKITIHRKNTDWLWETGGKIFCVVITAGLLFYSTGMFALISRLIAKL